MKGNTLMISRITSIFNTRDQAAAALAELRSLGVPDSNVSVVSRHLEPETLADRAVNEDVSEAAGTGLVSGAGVGALFGLAAVFIPGVGPFIAAGALVTAMGLGAATVATGAIVGASAGALGGALAKIGYEDQEAKYYADEIEQGFVFLAVNSDDYVIASPALIREIIVRHGGRFPVLAVV
jgi:uncharacterized membrane protein